MLKQCVPPFIKNWLLAQRTKKNLYSSFGAANDACNNRGYSDNLLMQAIKAKTFAYAKSLSVQQQISVNNSQLFLYNCILRLQKKQLNVVDVGGGFGGHYFLMQKLCPDIEFNWIIAEHPFTLEYAQDLPTNVRLVNSNTLPTLSDKIDLVFTSATLQHVEEPMAMIKNILSLPAQLVAFLRLGLSLQDPVYTIHKAWISDCGPGQLPDTFSNRIIEFPFQYMLKNDFQRLLKHHDEIISCRDFDGVISLPGLKIEGSNVLYAGNV